MQGRDHPVLLGVPETYYLKCFRPQARRVMTGSGRFRPDTTDDDRTVIGGAGIRLNACAALRTEGRNAHAPPPIADLRLQAPGGRPGAGSGTTWTIVGNRVG